MGSLRLRGHGWSRLAAVGGEIRASLEGTGLGQRPLRKRPSENDQEYLEAIRENGWIALSRLTSDDAFPAQVAQLRDYLLAVERAAPKVGYVPTLVLDSPVDLPLDIMPVFDFDGDWDFNATDAATLAAQSRDTFLGLRFAVRKDLSRADTSDSVIPGETGPRGGQVPLAPYWHRAVKGVDKELRELTNLGFFVIDQALPEESMSGRTAGRRLARLIAGGRPTPESIVHITSHCDAADDVPTPDHALRLAGGPRMQRGEVRVTAANLEFAGKRTARRRSGPGRLALISACGAADVRYDRPQSIPEALLRSGFRAVVSPLVSVTSGPSLAFALHLYRALSVGLTVGEAIVNARRLLLEEHGDPLGMLYTCYGNSGLHFSPELVSRGSRAVALAPQPRQLGSVG